MPDKTVHVQSQYGMRIEYAVIDLNYSDQVPHRQDNIKANLHLRQGKKFFKITRHRSDKSTYYNIIPA
jgi:hypothetical protein